MKVTYNPSYFDIEALAGNIVALDLETNSLKPWDGQILAIALAVKRSSGTISGYVIDTSQYKKEELIRALKALFSKETILVAHNAKFDVSFLYSCYGIMPEKIFCTQLAAQILENGINGQRYNLIAVLKRYLNIDLMEDNRKKLMRELYVAHKPGQALSMTMMDYAAEDTAHLLPLMEEQKRRLKDANLGMVMRLEHRLIKTLVKMEVRGCRIDVGGWSDAIKTWSEQEKTLITELDIEVEKLSEKFPVLKTPFYTGQRNLAMSYQLGLFGDDKKIAVEANKVQYDSVKQVVDMIELMGIQPPLKAVGKKEYNSLGENALANLVYIDDKPYKKSLDEDSIVSYLNENPDTVLRPFLTKLLSFRKVTKLLSTYGSSFLAGLDKENNIHTRYTQCRTTTGRLSSQEPNLQNIPPDIRKFFIPRDGNVMITSDMSAAEVRLAAGLSGEPLLIKVINEGLDIHSELASTTFSIIFNKDVVVDKSSDVVDVGRHQFVKSQLRQDHKTLLFSKFYKAGVGRVYSILAYYLNLLYPNKQEAMKVAGKVSKAIDKKLHKLSDFLNAMIERARRDGKLIGPAPIYRRRFFDEDAFGEAANFPIQCSNAEAMKIALIKIDDFFEKEGDGHLVLTVHDEVVVECKPENGERFGKVIATIMSSSLEMFLNGLKGDASFNTGYYWQK